MEALGIWSGAAGLGQAFSPVIADGPDAQDCPPG